MANISQRYCGDSANLRNLVFSLTNNPLTKLSEVSSTLSLCQKLKNLHLSIKNTNYRYMSNFNANNSMEII